MHGALPPGHISGMHFCAKYCIVLTQCCNAGGTTRLLADTTGVPLHPCSKAPPQPQLHPHSAHKIPISRSGSLRSLPQAPAASSNAGDLRTMPSLSPSLNLLDDETMDGLEVPPEMPGHSPLLAFSAAQTSQPRAGAADAAAAVSFALAGLCAHGLHGPSVACQLEVVCRLRGLPHRFQGLIVGSHQHLRPVLMQGQVTALSAARSLALWSNRGRQLLSSHRDPLRLSKTGLPMQGWRPAPLSARPLPTCSQVSPHVCHIRVTWVQEGAHVTAKCS